MGMSPLARLLRELVSLRKLLTQEKPRPLAEETAWVPKNFTASVDKDAFQYLLESSENKGR